MKKIYKFARKYLISITVLLIVSLSVLPVFATDTYEYNDFNLYTTSGSWLASGAFRSNTANLSSFQITINSTSSGNFNMAINGGTFVTYNAPSGYSVDYENLAENGYITCNGSTLHFIYNDMTTQYYSQSITTSGYPVVNVYIPFVAGSSVIPSTPVLSVSDGLLSWTPDGFHSRVWINHTGAADGWQVLMTDWDKNYYRPSMEADYKVQLIYTIDGNTRYTDLSNTIHVTPSEDDPSDDPVGPIQAILNLMNDIVEGFDNAASTIGQFISNVGSLIQTIFVWLPDPVRTVFYAVVIVGLVFGLFLK